MRTRTVLVTMIMLAFSAASALAGFAAKEVYLPSVGVGSGTGTSNWYTTIWVHNPGSAAANVRFELLERDKSNTSPAYVYNDTIPAGDTKNYVNALVTIFGIKDRRFGAIRVVANENVVVNGRIYSKEQSATEKDSVGQFFAGVPASFAIGPGESTTVLGVAQWTPQVDSEFRYNFGFVEVGGGSPVIEVVALDEHGDPVTTKAYFLRPYEAKQVNVTDLVPKPYLANARLQIKVLANSSGKVIAFGSGIANQSNDPSTFEMTFKDDLLAASGGSLTLPYSGSTSSGSSGFKVENKGAGAALEGTGASGYGVRAATKSGVAGVLGVAGAPSGLGTDGQTGVWGDSNQSVGVIGTSKQAIGVVGLGLTYGVLGESASGVGVVGNSSATTGITVGVAGTTHSDTGFGVTGDSLATSGQSHGVRGTTTSPAGFGVYGQNPAPGGIAIRGEGTTGGVVGTASADGGFAVMGTHKTSETLGMLGTSYHGVYGKADTSKGGTVGVYGLASGGGGVGVRATSLSMQDGVVGVYGFHSVSGSVGSGVYGASIASGGFGGRFVNTGGGTALWAGSTTGSLLELHRVATTSLETNRVFVGGIVGDVYSDGSFNCGRSSACFNSGAGADLAERIDASDTPEPGDVVEIDPDDVHRFRRARDPHSRLVAGVVSSQPAMTMNNNDLAGNAGSERRDSRPLLALVGQVPVKASAENGAIRVGDLLVSASTPGHVMRAEAAPPAGTVVGKALEPLAGESGTVLMLVMLR
jgi:hypothetical protein